MTQDCSFGKQPRMKAEGQSAEIRKIAFSYADATNLPSPDAPHMVRLVVTFWDA